MKLNKFVCLTKNVDIFQNESKFLINIPLKKNVTANETNFMDTELNNAIMFHSEFQYKFLKRRSNNKRLNEVLKRFYPIY